MKNDFLIAIAQVCNERNLAREVVFEAIEAALTSAYKKNYGTAQNVSVKIDPETGKARVFAEHLVVEKVEDPATQISLADAQKIDPKASIGSTVLVELTPRDFGRIAAQTAKQIILQRIREAERDTQYADWAERVGEKISGTVRNVDPKGNVVLSLHRGEAILPPSEQIPGEYYAQNQRLKVYVYDVEKTPRGPRVWVSRTHRQLLKRLLEDEVPEVAAGTVEVKAIAREPGSRSKVAVAALQPGVDPVGSCVGMRGVRIQNIVNELNGEKIDVVAWDENMATFIGNALSPAKVDSVVLDEASKTATVVVPDKQLSLAIGKEGQNARLAAKLTGWRIDIKSASEAAEEAQRRAAEEAEAAAQAEKEAEAIAAAQALLAEAEASLAQEGEAMPVAEESVVEIAEAAEEALVPTEETQPIEPEPQAVEEPLAAAPVVEAMPIPEEIEAVDQEPEYEEFWEEEEEEETLDHKISEKKRRKERRRALVYDERLGQVIVQRKRKPGRSREPWDEEEEY
ncbi:MAG: transcription termination/antitermination protein NusA [Chloroflexi bacterium]|nr:transcription termination/antitermination protein NusA [Chloroflexota bacterium]